MSSVQPPDLDQDSVATAPAAAADGSPVFEHVGIGVPSRHWPDAVDFYERVLGMKNVLGGKGSTLQPDVSYVFMANGPAAPFIALVRQECEPLSPPHHVAFNVGEAAWDTFIARLASEGVGLEQEGVSDRGVPFLYLRDPAGNLLQLIKGRRSF